MFQKFRQWIVKVYEDARELNVEIDDEIRSVFDKLVVAEVANAEAQAAVPPSIMSFEDSGMTQAEYEAYVRKLKANREISQGKLDKEILADEMKKKTREFNNRVGKLTEELLQEMQGERAYAAIRFLQTGEGFEYERFKLNGPELEAYGPEVMDKLPKGKNAITADDGMDLETAADLLGYDSADAMVQDMADRKDLATDARKRAKAMAEQELGFKPKDAKQLKQAALDSLMTKGRTDELFMELKALDRLTGGVGQPRDVLKNVARRRVMETKTGDLKPGTFLAASIRFAQESARKKRAKDMEGAAKAKRQQILNHLMYMYSRDAKNSLDGQRRYFKKFNSKGVQKNIAADYLDQIFNRR